MTNASSQANELWPFLLPMVQRVARSTGSNGGGGGGGGGSTITTLAGLDDINFTSLADGDTIAYDIATGKWLNTVPGGILTTPFLKTDGSRALTGNMAVNSGVTIDGVDLSVFKAAYDVHVADPDAHHDHATSGNTAIGLSTQVISLVLATSSGLAIASGLKVDLTHDFAWTGTHSFTQDLQVNADIDFVGAQQITTSAGHLTLNPFDDLVLPTVKTSRSFDYADGIPIAGYSLHVNSGGFRQLTTHTIKADEMHVRVFIADTVRVDVGEEYWGKSMGIVYADFTTPSAIGGTTVITFEDSVALHGDIFANADWIMISTVDIAVGLEVNQIWGQVSSSTDLGADVNGVGRQSWVFTLRNGPVNWPVKKGRLAIDFGVSGQGYVHLSTLDDAQGPWIQIGTWAGANPYTSGNRTIRTEIGNLSNISDPLFSPTGYGLYSENAYLHGIVRTAQTIMDDEGLALEIQNLDGSIIVDTSEFSHIAWWDDLGVRTGTPKAEIISYIDSSGFLEAGKVFNRFQVNVEFAGYDASIVEIGAFLMDSRHPVLLGKAMTIAGELLPYTDITYNLGSASFRWATVYADNINVSGSLSVGSIGGATWTYPGSMVIDAVGSGTRTVSVTNSGAGQANLDVDNNITLGGLVDGVDLGALGVSYFAHIANPAAHHNPVTAGSGISLSVQVVSVDATVVRTTRSIATSGALAGGGDLSANRTLSLTLAFASGLNQTSGLAVDTSIAGDGMTMASGVLNVVAASTGGMQINSNDIAIKLPAPSGLTSDVSGLSLADTVAGAGLTIAAKVLAIGTPTTLTVASTNTVSASTHAHAITASADVSAGVAALLKSSAAGGLTLASLDVEGSVDIQGGGDLTVGANIFFVDSSLESIGVNRAPDPQFDVDIAGNLRAAYIVGKHAIQLNNALFIAHYDTKEPFGLNPYGDLHGHRGQTPTVLGGVAVQPGKFYSSLTVGPVNTNYILNPRFDVNTTDGWTNILGGGTITRSTERAYIGQASAKLTFGTTGTQLRDTNTLVVANGATVTISAWIYRVNGTGSVFLSLRNTGTTLFDAEVSVGGIGVWTECIVTYTNFSGSSQSYQLWVRLNSADTIYVSGCQKTLGLPTNYFDGALGGFDSSGNPDGSGFTWSGTAHNSTSNRVASNISYSTSGNVNGVRGTVMFWSRQRWGNVAASQGTVYFFSVSFSSLLYLRKVASSTQLRVGINGADSAITYNWGGWDVNWHHFAISWESTTNTSWLYIDGQLAATGTAGEFAPGASFWVGSQNIGSNPLDGYIDDFTITSDVVAAGQIRAIYESDAPVFAESSVFHFRATPLGLVWADEEGLWMRNAAGANVLGAYGGSATKSWGGLTLSPSDFLIGDAARGAYALWDDSAGLFILGKTGATTTNLTLSGTDLSFRVNATERVKLSGAGVLEIKDSGGAAVFTFNASAGAEFTKPLTLATTGGIYQGTGTFASPTTGLKIYNSSGIGKLSTYNAGVEQVKFDTDGRLYAGAGSVILDSGGIQIVGAASMTNPGNAVRYTVGGTSYGELRAYVDTSINQMYLRTFSLAGRASTIFLTAESQTGLLSEISLQTNVNSLPTSVMALGLGDTTGAVWISQPSTTGATSVLSLEQHDISEEFIDFQISSISAGSAIDTAAVGTYYGKVRVSVNGAMKFLALYNS